MEKLETDRRLAGDHVEIVVGRDRRHAGLGGDLPAMLGGGRVVVAGELDHCAESAHGAHLDRRSRLRHHDPRPEAEARRREGDALSVISRRGGDHTRRALRFG